jgi:ATP-dependent Clp protease protease subunit
LPLILFSGEEVNTSPLSLPPEVYAVFCGKIDNESGFSLFESLTMAIEQSVREFHLLFQCDGGEVGVGFSLYSFLHSIPLDVTLYNTGKISSMGVIAYLGSRKRKASPHSSFMIHKVRCGELSGVPANLLWSIVDAMRIDDIRYEATIRKHTNIPVDVWAQFNNHDMNFSAEDAVKFGIADEIGEFSPPAGSKVFSI